MNRIFHFNVSKKKGVLFIVTVFFVVGFSSVNTFVYDDTQKKYQLTQSHCYTEHIALLHTTIERMYAMQRK